MTVKAAEPLLKPIDPKRLKGSTNPEVEAFVLEQCDRAAIGELMNLWNLLSKGTGEQFAMVRQICGQRVQNIINQKAGAILVEDPQLKRWILRVTKHMDKYEATRGVIPVKPK